MDRGWKVGHVEHMLPRPSWLLVVSSSLCQCRHVSEPTNLGLI